MNILIISYLFAPDNSIGAIRPTKLAKYLVKAGHNIDIVTLYKDKSDIEGQSIPNGIRNIITIKKTKTCESIQNFPVKLSRLKYKHNNKVESPAKEIQETQITTVAPTNMFKKNILTCFSNYGFWSYYKQFKKYMNKANKDYDCIYSSFGPLPSLLCGLHMKKVLPHAKWICEFRDPVVVEDNPTWFKKHYQRLQNKACKKADHIVAVSDGYLKRICRDKYISKRHMIPNGYDTDDIAVSKSCVQPVDVLHIAYVGVLYEGKRKITPLFRVLRELADAGEIDLNRICFDYAGRSGAYLRVQADELGLSSMIRYHGVLSREECLKLQFSSHLLVLSTWNNRGEEGVFPGKFLEYMLIGRPIISLTDGNIPDGEVTQVMREGKFGVAYESVHDKEDMVQLKHYIKTCYDEWLQKGCITFEPVQGVLDRYNYDNIIKKIEELISE